MMCLVLLAYCIQGVCWKSSMEDILFFDPKFFVQTGIWWSFLYKSVCQDWVLWYIPVAIIVLVLAYCFLYCWLLDLIASFSALVSQFGTLILPLVVYMMIYERYLLNLVDWLLLVWRYICETELVYSMGIILFYTTFGTLIFVGYCLRWR